MKPLALTIALLAAAPAAAQVATPAPVDTRRTEELQLEGNSACTFDAITDLTLFRSHNPLIAVRNLPDAIYSRGSEPGLGEPRLAVFAYAGGTPNWRGIRVSPAFQISGTDDELRRYRGARLVLDGRDSGIALRPTRPPLSPGIDFVPRRADRGRLAAALAAAREIDFHPIRDDDPRPEHHRIRPIGLSAMPAALRAVNFSCDGAAPEPS